MGCRPLSLSQRGATKLSRWGTPRSLRSFSRVDRIFTRIASFISGLAGKPLAFLLASAIMVVWGVSGPLFAFSDTWQLVVNTGTTVVTFLMVFLIQNAQNRDGRAIQAKLDELIRAVAEAREQFIGIEHLPDTAIEQVRQKLEEEVGGETGKQKTADDSVARLLDRR